jgi:hypothetical protein
MARDDRWRHHRRERTGARVIRSAAFPIGPGHGRVTYNQLITRQKRALIDIRTIIATIQAERNGHG